MAAVRLNKDNCLAIVVREEGPVVVRICTDDGRCVVLERVDCQPHADTLMAIVEAQGGLSNPGGVFRYDPALANAGIKNCADCGAIWQVRGSVTDPYFLPTKCPKCQAPIRGRRGQKTP